MYTHRYIRSRLVEENPSDQYDLFLKQHHHHSGPRLSADSPGRNRCSVTDEIYEYWTNGRTTLLSTDIENNQRPSYLSGTMACWQDCCVISPQETSISLSSTFQDIQELPPLPPATVMSMGKNNGSDKNFIRNSLIAGSAAGMASTIACHPFDVLRVKMQSSAPMATIAATNATTNSLAASSFAASSSTASSTTAPGIWGTLRHTLQIGGGVRALYTGLTLPLAAQALFKSTVFTVNKVTETAITEWKTQENYKIGSFERHHLTMWDRFISGGMGGAINAVLFCTPVEYVRNQQIASIVYIHKLDCYESDGTTPSDRIYKRGSLDIFQMCHLNNVYGWKDENGDVVKTAKDPRIGRVVATLRYEWYWIWAQYYNPNVWIMLVDARDSFFQTNPFADLPRNQNGLLYFFGENAEATRLGKSTKNRNWLLRSYGEETLHALSNKPTICSGSTMGEQLAIETYLRAMVNEWDETDIKMTGADQGFHNYLYYSGKLANSKSISKLVVWEQGKGIINNLGALRTKNFVDWGFYDPDKHEVYNWDGTLSPVAHQWDRDKHLHDYYQKVAFKKWTRSFESKLQAGEVKGA